MVFLATKAALAATIVGIGVTFGALSYLARRSQENNSNNNGIESSNFNFDASGSNRGLSFLFPQSSKEPPPPSSSPPEGSGSRPLFSFPNGGFRLFGASSSSPSSSSFLRDCNCKVIHECSTFFGGASHSFRLRRTCGFQGFQRKICCDDRPTFFSTPPPHFALDEMKSAHANLNTNNVNCQHNHGADGSTNGCKCDHNHDFDDSNKDSGSKTEGSFRDEANVAAGEETTTTTASYPFQVQGNTAAAVTVPEAQDEEEQITATTSKPRLNFPDLAEYFKDDEKSSQGVSTQVPLETLFSNDDADASQGRNDRIDALFGENGEKSTDKSTSDDDSSNVSSAIKFPSLSEYFPDQGTASEISKQLDTTTSTTTTTEVPLRVQSEETDERQSTPSTSEATTTTVTTSTTEENDVLPETRDAGTKVPLDTADETTSAKSSDIASSSPSTTTTTTEVPLRVQSDETDQGQSILKSESSTSEASTTTVTTSTTEENDVLPETRDAGTKIPIDTADEITSAKSSDIASSPSSTTTVETTPKNRDDETETIRMSPVLSNIDNDDIFIIGTPETTTAKKIISSEPPFNEEFPDVTESIISGNGAQKPQSLEFEHSLISESPATAISSTVEPRITTTTSHPAPFETTVTASDSKDRRPLALSGVHEQSNDFNEKVTTINSIMLEDSEREQVGSSSSTEVSNENTEASSTHLENSGSSDIGQVSTTTRESMDEHEFVSSTLSSATTESKLEHEKFSFEDNDDLTASSPSSIDHITTSTKDNLQTDALPPKDATTTTEPGLSGVDDGVPETIETTTSSRVSSFPLEMMVTEKAEIITPSHQNDESTTTLTSKQSEAPDPTEPSTTVPNAFIMKEYANTPDSSDNSATTEQVLSSSQVPEISTTGQDDESKLSNVYDRINDHPQTTTVASRKEQDDVATTVNTLVDDEHDNKDISSMDPLVEHSITTTIRSLLDDVISMISSVTTTTPSPSEDVQEGIQMTTGKLNEPKQTTIAPVGEENHETESIPTSTEINVKHSAIENQGTEREIIDSIALAFPTEKMDETTTPSRVIQTASTPSPLQRGGDYSNEDYSQNELPTARKVATPSTGQVETNSVNDLSRDELTLKSTTVMPNDTDLSSTVGTQNEGDTLEPDEQMYSTTTPLDKNEVTAGTLKIIELPATTRIPKITTTTHESTTVDNVENEQTTTIKQSNEEVASNNVFGTMESSTVRLGSTSNPTSTTDYESRDSTSTSKTDVFRIEMSVATSAPTELNAKDVDIAMSYEEATTTTSDSKLGERISEMTEASVEHVTETTVVSAKTAMQAETSTSASLDLSSITTEIPTTISSPIMTNTAATNEVHEGDSTSMPSMNDEDTPTTTTTMISPSTLRILEHFGDASIGTTITTTMRTAFEDRNNEILADDDDTSADMITTQNPIVTQINEESQAPSSAGETTPSTTKVETTTVRLPIAADITTKTVTTQYPVETTMSSVTEANTEVTLENDDITHKPIVMQIGEERQTPVSLLKEENSSSERPEYTTLPSRSPNAGETTSRTPVEQTTFRLSDDSDIATEEKAVTTQKTIESTMSSVKEANTETYRENVDSTHNPTVMHIGEEGQTPGSLLKEENSSSETPDPTTLSPASAEETTTFNTIVQSITRFFDDSSVSTEEKVVTTQKTAESTMRIVGDGTTEAPGENDDGDNMITTSSPIVKHPGEDSKAPMSLLKEEGSSSERPDPTTLSPVSLTAGETTTLNPVVQTTTRISDDSGISAEEKAVTTQKAVGTTMSAVTDATTTAPITTIGEEMKTQASMKEDSSAFKTLDSTTLSSVSLSAGETTTLTTVVQNISDEPDISSEEKAVTTQKTIETTVSSVKDGNTEAPVENDDSDNKITTYSPIVMHPGEDSTTPVSLLKEESSSSEITDSTTLSPVSLTAGETTTSNTIVQTTTQLFDDSSVSTKEKVGTTQKTIESTVTSVADGTTEENDDSDNKITTYSPIVMHPGEDSTTPVSLLKEEGSSSERPDLTTLSPASVTAGETTTSTSVVQTTLRLSDDFGVSAEEKTVTTQKTASTTMLSAIDSTTEAPVDNNDSDKITTYNPIVMNIYEESKTPVSLLKEESSSSETPDPTTLSPALVTAGETTTPNTVVQTTTRLSYDSRISTEEKAVTTQKTIIESTISSVKDGTTENSVNNDDGDSMITTYTPIVMQIGEEGKTPVLLLKEENSSSETTDSTTLSPVSVAAGETTTSTTVVQTTLRPLGDSVISREEETVTTQKASETTISSVSEVSTTASGVSDRNNDAPFENDDTAEVITTFNPIITQNDGSSVTSMPQVKEEKTSSETSDSTTMNSGESTSAAMNEQTTPRLPDDSTISTRVKSVTTTEMPIEPLVENDDTTQFSTTPNPSISTDDGIGSTPAVLQEKSTSFTTEIPSTMSPVSMNSGESFSSTMDTHTTLSPETFTTEKSEMSKTSASYMSTTSRATVAENDDTTEPVTTFPSITLNDESTSTPASLMREGADLSSATTLQSTSLGTEETTLPTMTAQTNSRESDDFDLSTGEKTVSTISTTEMPTTTTSREPSADIEPLVENDDTTEFSTTANPSIDDGIGSTSKHTSSAATEIPTTMSPVSTNSGESSSSTMNAHTTLPTGDSEAFTTTENPEMSKTSAPYMSTTNRTPGIENDDTTEFSTTAPVMREGPGSFETLAPTTMESVSTGTEETTLPTMTNESASDLPTEEKTVSTASTTEMPTTTTKDGSAEIITTLNPSITQNDEVGSTPMSLVKEENAFSETPEQTTLSSVSFSTGETNSHSTALPTTTTTRLFDDSDISSGKAITTTEMPATTTSGATNANNEDPFDNSDFSKTATTLNPESNQNDEDGFTTTPVPLQNVESKSSEIPDATTISSVSMNSGESTSSTMDVQTTLRLPDDSTISTGVKSVTTTEMPTTTVSSSNTDDEASFTNDDTAEVITTLNPSIIKNDEGDSTTPVSLMMEDENFSNTQNSIAMTMVPLQSEVTTSTEMVSPTSTLSVLNESNSFMKEEEIITTTTETPTTINTVAPNVKSELVSEEEGQTTIISIATPREENASNTIDSTTMSPMSLYNEEVASTEMASPTTAQSILEDSDQIMEKIKTVTTTTTEIPMTSMKSDDVNSENGNVGFTTTLKPNYNENETTTVVSNDENTMGEVTTDSSTSPIATNTMAYMEEITSTPGATAVPMMSDEIMMGEDGLPITEITKSVRREPDTDKTVVELRAMSSNETNKVGKTVTAEKSGSEATVSELTTESPVFTTTTFSSLELKTTTEIPLSMNEMGEEDSTTMLVDTLEVSTTMETATDVNLMFDDKRQNETEMLQGRTAGRGVPLPISHTLDLRVAGNTSSSTNSTDILAPTTEKLNANETLEMDDPDEMGLMTTTTSFGILNDTSSETVKSTEMESTTQFDGVENETFATSERTEESTIKSEMTTGKYETTEKGENESTTVREMSQILTMDDKVMLNMTLHDISGTTASAVDEITTENILELAMETTTLKNEMVVGVSGKFADFESTTQFDESANVEENATMANIMQNEYQTTTSLPNLNVSTLPDNTTELSSPQTDDGVTSTTISPPTTSTTTGLQDNTIDSMSEDEMISTTFASKSLDTSEQTDLLTTSVRPQELETSTEVETITTMGQGETSEKMSEKTDRPLDVTVQPRDDIMETTTIDMNTSTLSSSIDREMTTQDENAAVQDMTTFSPNTTPKQSSSSTETIVSDEEIMNTGSTMPPSFSEMTTGFAVDATYESTTESNDQGNSTTTSKSDLLAMTASTTPLPKVANMTDENLTTFMPRFNESFETTTENNVPDYDISKLVEVEPPKYDSFETNTFSPPGTHDLSKSNDSVSTPPPSYMDSTTTTTTATEMDSSTDKVDQSTTSAFMNMARDTVGEIMQTTMNVFEEKEIMTVTPSMSIDDVNESEQSTIDTTTVINKLSITTQKEMDNIETTTANQLINDVDDIRSNSTGDFDTTLPTELGITTTNNLPDGEPTTVSSEEKIERTTQGVGEKETAGVNDEMASTTIGSSASKTSTLADMLETTTAESIVEDETTYIPVTEQTTENSVVSSQSLFVDKYNNSLDITTTTMKAGEAVTLDEAGSVTTSLPFMEIAYDEASTKANLISEDVKSTTTKLDDMEASTLVSEQSGMTTTNSPGETHASYAATTEYPDTADMITTTDNPSNESLPTMMDDVEEMTSTPGPTAVPMMSDEIMMGEDGLPITEITKSVRREPDTDKTVVELRYMLSKEKNKVGKTVTAEKSGSEATVSELTTESPVSTTTTFSSLELKTTTEIPSSLNEMGEGDSTTTEIDSLEISTTMETATGVNLMLDDKQQNETEMLQGRTAGRGVPLPNLLHTTESTASRMTGNATSSTISADRMAPTTERLNVNETLLMNDANEIGSMTTTASSGILELTETMKPVELEGTTQSNDESESSSSTSEKSSTIHSEEVTEIMDLEENGKGTMSEMMDDAVIFEDATGKSEIENTTIAVETVDVINGATTPIIDDTTTETLDEHSVGNTTDSGIKTAVTDAAEMTQQMYTESSAGSTIFPEVIMDDDDILADNETISMSTPATDLEEKEMPRQQQYGMSDIMENISTSTTDALFTTTTEENTVRSEMTTATEGTEGMIDLVGVTSPPDFVEQIHNNTLNLATTTFVPNDTDISTPSTNVEMMSTTLGGVTRVPGVETTELSVPTSTNNSSSPELLDDIVPRSTESVLAVTEPNYPIVFNDDDFNETSSMHPIMTTNLPEQDELPTTETPRDFETTVSTAALQDIYDALFGSSSRSARVNTLGSDNNNRHTIVDNADTDTTTLRTTTTPEPPFKVEVKVGPYDNRSLFSSDITPVERQLEGEISNVVTQLLLTTHQNFKLLPNFVECAGARGRTGRRKTKVLHFDTENYPWMARVGFREPGGVLFPCAGTIISRRYILTSAHCALRKANGTASIMEILLEGAKNAAAGMSDQTQYKYKVEQVLPHPNYDSKTRENDVALIRLATEIPPFNGSSEVKPICLPFEDGYGVWDSLPVEGETAYLGGWGYGLKSMAAKVEEMEEAAVTIWSNQNCTHLYRGDREKIITPKHICAYGNAEKDACRGDYGGPLMALMTRQKIFFQIGVVSYGPRCGYGVPGVYTRVSNYLSWILDAMQP